jgi:hypothetical protein
MCMHMCVNMCELMYFNTYQYIYADMDVDVAATNLQRVGKGYLCIIYTYMFKYTLIYRYICINIYVLIYMY